MSDNLLEVTDLTVRYVSSRSLVLNRPTSHITAVDKLSLTVPRGTSYGLVGESGSGKSSAGRALLRLEEIAGGQVVFDGQDITNLSGEPLRQLRRRMQMVFQDPIGSLNPRQRISTILTKPLRVQGSHDRRENLRRAGEALELVGLSKSVLDRWPHEFSGGQRQRIGIARAVVLNPELLVADEPVSALDVSVQAQIINLLLDIKAELNLTSLVIAHNLAVVRQLCETVGVMYLGSLAEEAPASQIFSTPAHPYTRALLSAAPIPDPHVEDQRERIVLEGDPPSPAQRHKGCKFVGRCALRQPTRCADEPPVLREIGPGHRVACHFAELLLDEQAAATAHLPSALVTPPPAV
ncbi:MAG: ATP-binding cassette domain-containing protein [Bifidobacteriaceae bacterium]|jgi:oligopeptide/dipeptide ABC transporter ATP-binding protein|nr:ATP-binding cassette domain-containing protein [Bifidobacteriaceae bacterium]